MSISKHDQPELKLVSEMDAQKLSLARATSGYYSEADALWMAAGFSLLFFGVGAVQQYTVVWFSKREMPEIGRLALVLIYAHFFIGSFQAHRVVERIGPKVCFRITSIVYSFMLVAFCIGYPALVLISAVLSGLAASILWTSQPIVINRLADEDARVRQATYFGMLYPLGTGVGATLLGMLVTPWGYSVSVGLFALVCFASILCFSRIRNISIDAAHHSRIMPSFARIALELGVTVLASRLVYGMVIAQIPVDIKVHVGESYVGLICAPFFVLPAMLGTSPAVIVNRLGISQAGVIAFLFSIVGLFLLLSDQGMWSIVLGVTVLSFAFMLLSIVSAVLPNWIVDRCDNSLPQVAGTFSIAGSAGILLGLVNSAIFAGPIAYVLAIVTMAIGLLYFCKWMLWLRPDERLGTP